MNETFVLTISISGNLGRVDPARSSFTIVIQANDAPLRFAKALYHVSEANETKTLVVEVLRGLGPKGMTKIGPTDSVASVNYFLSSGTAKFGKDFTGGNGSIGFGIGETKKTVTMTILADNIPEGAETFSLELKNATGEVRSVENL